MQDIDRDMLDNWFHNHVGDAVEEDIRITDCWDDEDIVGYIVSPQDYALLVKAKEQAGKEHG